MYALLHSFPLVAMHAIANCCFQCLIRWVAEASSTALIAIGKVAAEQQEQRILIDVKRLKHLNIFTIRFTEFHRRILPAWVSLLFIVAKVGVVGIIVIFFIPFIPTFPHDAVRIGTFPKVAEQPTALGAEFLLHDPHCYTHRTSTSPK